MSFDLDPIYLIYLLVAASAGLFVEGIYLLFFAGGSYRKNVNRRLKLLKDSQSVADKLGSVTVKISQYGIDKAAFKDGNIEAS